jgi:hypothetical protein
MTTGPHVILVRRLNIVLIITILLSAALALSNDKEEADENLLPGDKLLTNSPALDSIYSTINENYQSVRHIFEYSCFDCHTTYTNYPWYHGIPGIKGMIDEDIEHGRSHLEMSGDFPFGGDDDQAHILEEIKEEIEEGAMPLRSYRLTHWGRLIEGEKRDTVFKWLDESLALLKTLE